MHFACQLGSRFAPIGVEMWFDSQDYLHENGLVRHASDFQFAHARNVRSRMAR